MKRRTRSVALVGGPRDGGAIEMAGVAAYIEIPMCETVFSPVHEIHRYQLTDPWTARWVGSTRQDADD